MQWAGCTHTAWKKKWWWWWRFNYNDYNLLDVYFVPNTFTCIILCNLNNSIKWETISILTMRKLMFKGLNNFPNLQTWLIGGADIQTRSPCPQSTFYWRSNTGKTIWWMRVRLKRIYYLIEHSIYGVVEDRKPLKFS